MLPSKKSIRNLKTLPFYGRVQHYHIPNKNYIAFSIKIIDRKKYLVIIGADKNNEVNENFITVISKDGEARTLLPNGKWSSTLNHLYWSYRDYAKVYNDDCVTRFFKDCGNCYSPLSCVFRQYASYKQKQKQRKIIENQKLKNQFWEDKLPLVSRKFRNFCYDSYGYNVIFSVADRKTGFCTKCKKKITFSENLVMGHTYSCPYCKKKLVAKSVNKISNNKFKCFTLLDTYNNSQVVVRHFDLSFDIVPKVVNNHITNIDVKRNLFEYERDLFSFGLDSFDYHINRYDYSTGVRYWNNKKPSQCFYMFGSLPYRYYESEVIYTGNFADLKDFVGEKFPILNAILYNQGKDSLFSYYRLEDYLLNSASTLLAEKLNKVGLKRLAKDVLDASFNWNCYGIPKIENNKLSVKAFLGVNKKFINFAISKDMHYNTIFAMKKYNEIFKDKFEDFVYLYSYCEHQKINSIDVIINNIVSFCQEYKTTIRQVVSYLSKQEGSIIELNDYVSMYLEAYRLSSNNKDFTVTKYSKDFLFPQNLMKAHNSAEIWLKDEKDKAKKKDFIKKEKQLKKVVKKLAKLDGLNLGEYKFTLPHSNKDFIRQGTEMHICVGCGTYFDKMCSGVGIIIFVEKQDKNYGTIEYSINDKTVSLVQARGFSNKNISDVCSDELMQIQKLLQSKISA